MEANHVSPTVNLCLIIVTTITAWIAETFQSVGGIMEHSTRFLPWATFVFFIVINYKTIIINIWEILIKVWGILRKIWNIRLLK